MGGYNKQVPGYVERLNRKTAETEWVPNRAMRNRMVDMAKAAKKSVQLKATRDGERAAEKRVRVIRRKMRDVSVAK